MNIAVETVALRRTFGDVEAVCGVDLAIEAGEIYGFLGPNGAGKSTTLRILCTLLLPTSGYARVAGFDVATQAQDVRLRIGAALQNAALDDRQTGRELLGLQGRLYGLRKSDLALRIEELGELVGIGEALDRRIGTYSGGMRRRVDLAAALVHNPEILFLDEPTTGLDPVSRERVWSEVRRVSGEFGTTILLTTQYLEEADALAQRVGIIDHGRLVAEGSPESLKRSIGSDVIVARLAGEDLGAESIEAAKRSVSSLAGVQEVSVHMLGDEGAELTASVTNGSALVSSVAVALDQCGVSVATLTLRTPSLDDVFLAATGERIREETLA